MLLLKKSKPRKKILSKYILLRISIDSVPENLVYKFRINLSINLSNSSARQLSSEKTKKVKPWKMFGLREKIRENQESEDWNLNLEPRKILVLWIKWEILRPQSFAPHKSLHSVKAKIEQTNLEKFGSIKKKHQN